MDRLSPVILIKKQRIMTSVRPYAHKQPATIPQPRVGLWVDVSHRWLHFSCLTSVLVDSVTSFCQTS